MKIKYNDLVSVARGAIENPAKHHLTKVQCDLGSIDYCVQTIRVQASVTPDVSALQEIIRLAALAIILKKQEEAKLKTRGSIVSVGGQILGPTTVGLPAFDPDEASEGCIAVLDDGSCSGCCFYKGSNCSCTDEPVLCVPSNRKDGRYVHFVKKE